MDNGRMAGFGRSRPGRMTGAIGPVVARDAQGAGRLVAGLMADRRRIDGPKPIGLALLDNPSMREWLAGQGFQMRRRNLRMFSPVPRAVLMGSTIYSATGLGMG